MVVLHIDQFKKKLFAVDKIIRHYSFEKELRALKSFKQTLLQSLAFQMFLQQLNFFVYICELNLLSPVDGSGQIL